MIKPFSLLIVDDEHLVIDSLRRFFRKDEYQIHSAQNGNDALSFMRNTTVDLALIDLKMPEMDGMTLLKNIKEEFPAVIVIMLTGYGGIKDAVQALKLGANDFIEKPFSPVELHNKVQQLWTIWQLKQINVQLRNGMSEKFHYKNLIGDAPPMLQLKHFIAQIGISDISVLIQGESGTGKELVARAIHHHSPRSEQPFIPVDCASLSETVIESELFGHVKGSFTGAHMDTPGLVRAAEKGTLFLDEVGELPLSMQAKLLRTIQQREVRPVGSTKTFKVDVRILAATNRNLADEVYAGKFREDLFYRLNAVLLEVPPLRERKEDIPDLVSFFLKKFQIGSSAICNISPEALHCLEAYKWPGNVRELENVILRAVALSPNKIIHPADLTRSISGHENTGGTFPVEVQGDSLEAYEKAAIANALKKNNGNRRLAAQVLGIGEATLYRKLKNYQLD